MKIYSKQMVGVQADRLCDVCRNSVMVELNGHNYEEVGELSITLNRLSKLTYLGLWVKNTRKN
ncbi:hypothetical protein [Vibrio natriegens]|uniref:hypothetical protein n=1 Tax=Vibrio natriegens TaxID=691 RepID=UPI001FBBCD57|nr:hypothetical protein [Vibrio natriegens]